MIFKENIFHFEENISKVSPPLPCGVVGKRELGPAFSYKDVPKNNSSIRGGHVPTWNLTSSRFCFSEEGPSIVEGYASFGRLYPFFLLKDSSGLSISKQINFHR